MGKTQKSQKVEVGKEATRILRTVGHGEAFFFYEAIGRPTGESARSLSDFIEKVKSVKLESLLFHLQRGDFQNWIKKTLGDFRLAREIGAVLPSNGEDARIKIHSIIEKRIKELDRAPVTLLVNEDLTVKSPNSTP
jgi:hypothetical protein